MSRRQLPASGKLTIRWVALEHSETCRRVLDHVRLFSNSSRNSPVPVTDLNASERASIDLWCSKGMSHLDVVKIALDPTMRPRRTA